VVKQARVNVGTAGFGYKDWLGNLYPQYCQPGDYLRHYSSRFDTVELDSTFYGIPRETSVERWAASTPTQFRFAAKFPRTVTHEGTTAERLAEAGRFLRAMSSLGEKLGPLLLQFPPGFRPESRDLLERLVEVVPTENRLAVELRHPGWLEDTTFELLRKRNAALCLIDYPGMPRLDIRTADWTYIRLIGDHRDIVQDYSYIRYGRAEELDWWTDLMARFNGESLDIYAYINNHYSGHAPSTARRLLEVLAEKTL